MRQKLFPKGIYTGRRVNNSTNISSNMIKNVKITTINPQNPRHLRTLAETSCIIKQQVTLIILLCHIYNLLA